MNQRTHLRPGRIILLLIVLVGLYGAATPASAQSKNVAGNFPPGFVQEIVADRLDGPTAFAFAPDGRIFFTQKSGVVRVFANGALLKENFLDISDQVNHTYNRGLVGIAVHPNFPQTPYIYLSYVYEPPEARGYKAGGARLGRIVRVSADPANLNRALPDSLVVLVGANSTFDKIGNPDKSDSLPLTCQNDQDQPEQDCLPVEGTAHQPNMLVFGRDGALYVGIGDGTDSSIGSWRAQHLDSLGGKILRIHPLTGAGYANNPFYNGDPNSNRSKVFMLGLRNPFRLAFHPTTGELFIGEVGNFQWEEINRGRTGANFGWPCFEGPDPTLPGSLCDPLHKNPNRLSFPVYTYPHSGGLGAVMGGDFYTGTLWPEKYRGAYFFADYNSQKLFTMNLKNNPPAVEEFAQNANGIVQITNAPDGHLYVLSVRGGALFRIRYVGESTSASPSSTPA